MHRQLGEVVRRGFEIPAVQGVEARPQCAQRLRPWTEPRGGRTGERERSALQQQHDCDERLHVSAALR